MPEQKVCPHCGQTIGFAAARCPACGKDIAPVRETALPPAARHKGTGPLVEFHEPLITPEILISRLGDFLVEDGKISADDLTRALEYQEKKASMGQPRLLGRILIELGMLDRETLDQVITGRIINLQEALKETNSSLEARVISRTQELETRLALIHTAAEITQLAISAGNLDELLHRTVDLIVERLNYYHAGIYLVDETGNQAVLHASAGTHASPGLRSRSISLFSESKSLIARVALSRQPQVSESLNLPEDTQTTIPMTRSEAGIPIALGNQLLGVLDIHCTETKAFDTPVMQVLQTIANHIASVVENIRLLDQTQENLGETSMLYLASQQIARSPTSQDIYLALCRTLERSPFVTALLISTGIGTILEFQHDPTPTEAYASNRGQTHASLPIDLSAIQPLLAGESIFLSKDAPQIELPVELLELPAIKECASLALIPIHVAELPAAVIILGVRLKGALTPTNTQIYASLAEISSTALEKLRALENMEKRLTVLQTLDSVSQAISLETDLDRLYALIHAQVERVMGPVNFLIALYDPTTNTIEIPYAHEEDQVLNIPPIPLGEGLTSILIRTRQPLLLVEDTERQARELGARVVGAFPKSWLGVPLLVAGEASGALVVQDLQHEHRFDLDDQRLLSNLATQVAITVRNARLLEDTRRLAERERIVSEITTRLWSSTSPETILRTAILELGTRLGANRGWVRLDPETTPQPGDGLT